MTETPIHHVKFEMSPIFGVRATFTCTGDHAAKCHQQGGPDCECEVYHHVRQIDDGTWVHESQYPLLAPETHVMEGDDECGALVFLEECGDWYESYAGPDGVAPVDGPIHIAWEPAAESYVWWLSGTERAS